jgi:hypothetical protein
MIEKWPQTEDMIEHFEKWHEKGVARPLFSIGLMITSVGWAVREKPGCAST